MLVDRQKKVDIDANLQGMKDYFHKWKMELQGGCDRMERSYYGQVVGYKDDCSKQLWLDFFG